MTEPAVEVERVSKNFRLYAERNQSLKATALRWRRSRYEEFLALDDISFAVPTGSTFGIVGSNGSGKSTLLKCIARILVPNSGTIRTRGTVASLLELGSGFHPELTGRENVYLNASIMRIPRRDIEARFDAIVDFAGIGDFIDQPVKTYSSGMYVRLGFAVATHLDPDILLIDEVIAVGDANFQDKCLQKFADFRRQGKTVIVASHALGMVESLCDEIGQLDRGRLVEVRPSSVDSGAGYAGKLLEPDQTRRDDTPSIITKLEILDRHGYAVSDVQTGEPVTLRLTYDATTPIEKPVVALELRTPGGIRAWAQHSRDTEVLPATLSGPGVVELVIPKLAIQAGLYEARAAILNDSLTRMYDAHSFGFCLRVGNDSLNETLGLAILGGRWVVPVQNEARSSHEGET